MSRIGNRRLSIPEKVEVKVEGSVVSVKGPKGELTLDVNPLVKVEVDNNEVVVSMVSESKEANIISGTTNAHINNMLIGVSEGFTKELEAVGVGYRFSVSGNKIVVNAGYSHSIEVVIPEGITAKCESNTELTLSGYNKQKLSEFAANIRKIRKPEPYKGKGIRYKDEHIRRKEGKKAAK